MRRHGARVTDRYALDGLRTVTVENRSIRVTFVVDRGCDILEFLYKPRDVEFLWCSPEADRRGPFVPSSYNARAFMDHYRGGWQVLFPHASAPSQCAGAELGFHGEAWGLPWEYTIERDDPTRIEVLFRVRMLRTPFFLERRVTIDAERPVLRLSERVTNEGASELEFMWGHHPALGPPFLNEDCILEAPASSVRVAGAVQPWPVGSDGVDHSRLTREHSTAEVMKYLHDLDEGWVAVTRPDIGVGFGLVFDRAVFPTVWIWQEFQYTQGYPWFGRAYVLGVEPQSSLPGARESGGRMLRLAGGAALQTELVAVAFEARGVKHISKEGSVAPR